MKELRLTLTLIDDDRTLIVQCKNAKHIWAFDTTTLNIKYEFDYRILDLVNRRFRDGQASVDAKKKVVYITEDTGKVHKLDALTGKPVLSANLGYACPDLMTYAEDGFLAVQNCDQRFIAVWEDFGDRLCEIWRIPYPAGAKSVFLARFLPGRILAFYQKRDGFDLVIHPWLGQNILGKLEKVGRCSFPKLLMAERRDGTALVYIEFYERISVWIASAENGLSQLKTIEMSLALGGLTREKLIATPGDMSVATLYDMNAILENEGLTEIEDFCIRKLPLRSSPNSVNWFACGRRKFVSFRVNGNAWAEIKSYDFWSTQ